MKINILKDFSGKLFGCDHSRGEVAVVVEAGIQDIHNDAFCTDLINAGMAKAVGVEKVEEPEEVTDIADCVENLKKDFTVPELRIMYTKLTGKKPGKMKEASLAKAIAEIEDKHEA